MQVRGTPEHLEAAMSDKYQVGRIAFGDSQKRGSTGKLSDALEKLRNPAPGVTLVSHGWVKRCRMCELAGQHAKWHEYASGEVINPIALVQWLQAVKIDDVEEFRKAAIAYVAFITTLDMKRLDAEKSETGNQASTGTSGSLRSEAQD
jgi:hypothetical protein